MGSIIQRIISYILYWYDRIKNWASARMKASEKFVGVDDDEIDKALNMAIRFRKWGEAVNNNPTMKISDMPEADDNDEWVDIDIDVMYRKGKDVRWIRIVIPTRTNVTNEDLAEIIYNEIVNKGSPPGGDADILYMEIKSIIPTNQF